MRANRHSFLVWTIALLLGWHWSALSPNLATWRRRKCCEESTDDAGHNEGSTNDRVRKRTKRFQRCTMIITDGGVCQVPTNTTVSARQANKQQNNHGGSKRPRVRFASDSHGTWTGHLQGNEQTQRQFVTPANSTSRTFETPTKQQSQKATMTCGQLNQWSGPLWLQQPRTRDRNHIRVNDSTAHCINLMETPFLSEQMNKWMSECASNAWFEWITEDALMWHHLSGKMSVGRDYRLHIALCTQQLRFELVASR
eukprot:jgi/Bigna1/73521/fgenesh1_pg.24_\